MHANRIDDASPLSRQEASQLPVVQPLFRVFDRLRRNEAVHKTVSNLAALIQLALLLGAAAMSGLVLAIVI